MTGELNEAQVRAVNLIEILKEEAEEEGRHVRAPPADAVNWAEGDIRAYFQSSGTIYPPTSKPAPSQQPRLPPADPETFHRWFPGLALSRTSCAAPVLRVLCFTNAGNAEDLFTSEGTGARRAPSPLLEWCRENKAECLAPQYPGRGMRMKDARITCARDMAAALLPVVASKLYDTPWVLIAHSVGTWIGFEFLQACRAAGVPMPKAAFISAMPSPDIPMPDRPWRQQRSLNEAQFIEECRGWDISEVVFSPAMWPTYQPLLRADFTMFDEYTFTHTSSPPFEFPFMTFWGTRDRRVKEAHVRGWSKFAGGKFTIEAVEGNHLWPLDKAAKGVWLGRIAEELAQLGLEGSRSRSTGD